MVPGVNFGDVLLARLPFPDGVGFKLWPVLVIHEHGDGDLLVVKQWGSLAVTDADRTQQRLRSFFIRLSPAG